MDRIITDGTDSHVERPVTAHSRITGTSRSSERAGGRGSAEGSGIDWAAVTASVVSGMGVTIMLVLLGVATGLIAGDRGTSENEAQGILSGVGAWTVIAMIIGTFVGSVVGGRLARWLDRGSVGYHGITSWGLATLLTVALASLVSIGFATTANSAATSAIAADQVTEGQAGQSAGGAAGQQGAAGGGASEGKAERAAEDTADALGGTGLAIALGMMLTLVASLLGWWIGSRKRLLDIEREPTT